MLIIKKGNILNATENIICHQVNENGIMGGGLALQIAAQYPNVEIMYKSFCDEYDRKQWDIYGDYQLCDLGDNLIICNCFTQQHFNTRYDLIEKTFRQIKSYAKQNKLSVCVPWCYGCGIANGDWKKVEKTLIDIFDDYDLVVYKYNGKDNK